jgi:basic membrane protein A and related proteins
MAGTRWMPFRAAALAALALAGLCLSASCRKKAAGALESAHPLNAALALDYPGLGDRGKNDAAWKGFLEAAKRLGASLSDGRTSYRFGDRGRMRCLAPKALGRDRAQLARTLAADGASLVILVGEAYVDAVKEVSPDFPKTLFVVLDAPPRPDIGPNCRFVEFDGRQGAYLAGALAASISLTNDKAKLGFSGPDSDEQTASLSRAWRAGAIGEDAGLSKPGRLAVKLVKEDAVAGKKLVKGTSPGEAFSKLDKDGASMVFWADGVPSHDILESAKASGIYLICYSDDVAAGLKASGKASEAQAVLASVVKRFDKAVGIVLAAYSDPASAPQSMRLGLKEGCVELSVNESLRNLADPRMAAVEKASAALASGGANLAADGEEE